MIERRRFMSSSGFDGLTFEILESGNIYWELEEQEYGSGTHPQLPKTIQYSKNGGTWTNITATSSPGTAIPVVSGDKLRFKGELNGTYLKVNSGRYYYYFCLKFASSCNFIAHGKVESITGSGNCACLFQWCDKLNMTQGKKVVLPVLSSGDTIGYKSMFHGCEALNVAPEIPLTLEGTAPICMGMFSNCTSLTTAPSLPATTLAQDCYSYMFSNCTSLTTAPSLPATTLAKDCYLGMFSNCTSLTTAPSLPATTLAEYCYSHMFAYCSSLTTAPSLPATTLAQTCYSYMFSNCTSLTTTPSLPATILAENCYLGMFSNCTSLTTAPSSLPANRLQPFCYNSMFNRCTSLTTAPSLSATILAEGCYNSMFQWCTSLTTAPRLNANILVNDCYTSMFAECSNLSNIYCGAISHITLDLADCTYGWVTNVKSSGQITIKTNLESEWRAILDTDSGLPPGWTVKVV